MFEISSLIGIAIFIFILIFIIFSLILVKHFFSKKSLKIISKSIINGAWSMFLLFTVILILIYTQLSKEGYSFKTTYSAKIDYSTSPATLKVGTSDSNDIKLYNPFSDKEHIVFYFGPKPYVKVISNKKSAIVNNTLITNKKTIKQRVIIKPKDKIIVDNKEFIFNITPSKITLKSDSKLYQINTIVNKNIIFSNKTDADVKIDANTTFSIYVQNGNIHNKIFLTLIDGQDIFVNKKRLTLKNRFSNRVEFKKGDIIRLGYSDYKIDYNTKELTLHNIFFTPSILNILNIYSTTTIPNLTKNATGDTLSIWWMALITIVITWAVMMGILLIVKAISKKTNVGDGRFILYPFLYFTLFLIFLIFTSMINFTVLQYPQFSGYNKGALYTVLFVYTLMLFVFLIVWLAYKNFFIKWFESKKKILFIFATTIFIFLSIAITTLYDKSVYTSRYILGFNKTLLMTALDMTYIFSILGIGFGLFIGTLLNKDEMIFLDNKKVNINFFKSLLIYVGLGLMAGLGASLFLHEGAGIVVVETIKLLIFTLFLVIFTEDFKRNHQKKGFLFILFLSIIFLLFVVVSFRDTGSILQIIIAFSIITLFSYFYMKKVGIITKKVKLFVTFLSILLLMASIYWGSHTQNIRIHMWLDPFAQDLYPKNHFYMYYYEQIARGLYFIGQSKLFWHDFINNTYPVFANMHTDYIFAVTVNVLGWFGFGAIMLAFFITISSFWISIYSYQNTKIDIHRFIYGINVIFIAYFFSYIIINMLSVLQIIPLTDVPFPILTYARGLLILFFELYIFVAFINYLYLNYVDKKNIRRVI